MQLHQLKPYKKRRRKRVGRGGKRGTYSGRGVKGQKSRAGRRFPPVIRSLIKRYPKLRGYSFNPQIANTGIKIVNLDILDKNFKAGETVSPKTLFEKKLIRRTKGALPKIKILGNGKLVNDLIFENCLISKQAKEKIKKADGTIK